MGDGAEGRERMAATRPKPASATKPLSNRECGSSRRHRCRARAAPGARGNCRCRAPDGAARSFLRVPRVAGDAGEQAVGRSLPGWRRLAEENRASFARAGDRRRVLIQDLIDRARAASVGQPLVSRCPSPPSARRRAGRGARRSASASAGVPARPRSHGRPGKSVDLGSSARCGGATSAASATIVSLHRRTIPPRSHELLLS